jgi:SAM-dependent methyltransferase
MESYWDSLARQFQHQQPPLRPCAEDLRLLQRNVQDWQERNPQRQLRILLFGVTPEIAGFSWPENTFLLAVEKSQAMIDLIWPENIPGKREVVSGNWFDIQLEEASFDIVVGDGFSTGFAYPSDYRHIAEVISRWLKPDGRLIARLFVRTEKKETHEAIMADLRAGNIRRFDILKWRLGMAIQENVRQGVIVDEIYRAWKRIEEQWPSLAEEADWPRETVNTIKLYEGRNNRYAFPTINELNDAFSNHLKPVSTTFPDYDFGECCPSLVYCRRNGHD